MAITTARRAKTRAEKRRESASERLDVWRKRHAARLRGWDPVEAIRQSRTRR